MAKGSLSSHNVDQSQDLHNVVQSQDLHNVVQSQDLRRAIELSMVQQVFMGLSSFLCISQVARQTSFPGKSERPLQQWVQHSQFTTPRKAFSAFAGVPKYEQAVILEEAIHVAGEMCAGWHPD